MTHTPDAPEQTRIAHRLAELRMEHRDLDLAIDRLHENLLRKSVAADELTIKRLKKRKLQLKDTIARLESALIPDEPA